MYNKKTLLQAMAELNKAKAPKKPKDIITDPRGQWAHPGEVTRIPSKNITMKGVNYPVLGISNTGQKQMMQPGEDYTFPGADYVDEYPQMRKGGQRKKRKTKSIMGKNKLMEIGPLFKDYSKRIFDPNVNYFQDGGSNKNLFDNIYTTINPFNWGVDDYSKIPDFKKAYQAARKNGQKEFIWNNTRYNTKYAGTPQQQLKETGITDDRLGVKNNRSDDAYNFVKPSVYKDVEDVKQHLSNYYNHRNRFDDTEYKKLQEEYIKEGKKKNYNIKKIKALESKLKAYEPAFFGEDDPYSEDGWRIYLGKPQTKNTFSISKYKPTKANDKSINYYSLPDEFKNDLFNLYEQHGYNLPQRKLLNEEFFPNVFGEESSRARVLGNFTVNKGKDDKGDYISYYDKYDLNPNLPIVGQVLSLDNYVGKPFEIYDRIYVKDYGDGKQKRMYYSDEELSELDATKRNFDTLALQKELLNRGYKLSKSTKNDGTLDGVFGDETKQFLKEWQSKNKKQSGGEYIELDLTQKEIEEYRKGGYIVEDISVPELNQAQKGIISTKAHTDKKGNKTIVVTKDDGTKYTKVIDKEDKVYNKTQPGLHPVMREYFREKAEWEDRSSGAAQPVDDFWTLPIGMTSAGVKGAGALVKGAGSTLAKAVKSPLVQASKAGTKAVFNKAPKSLPGLTLNNALTASGVGFGIQDYLDKESDVNKATKKAYDNPTFGNVGNAASEHVLNLLNFSGLGTSNKLSKASKYFKNLNKKPSSVQLSAKELTNEYIPNTLINHPDNEFILQKTPVKDFGIKLNIKNKPNKSKHGFDVSEAEINQVINQNLEYLNHPEYIKRRQATTGESPEKIKKEIKDYVNNLKQTEFNFDTHTADNSYGSHKRGTKLFGKTLSKPKITINSSDKDIKTKHDFLHILDHEIKHGLSPVSKNTFSAMPKYKNYPHLNLVKSGKNANYHNKDYEQQVRFLRMKDYLNNKYGVSKNKEITPDEWNLFKDDWNNWLKEEHVGLGNERVPRGYKDIRGMMQLKDKSVTSDDLRKLVNKAWAAAPVAVGSAVMLNNKNASKKSKMKKGGMVLELTPNEIEEYIKQGYTVEDVD